MIANELLSWYFYLGKAAKMHKCFSKKSENTLVYFD